MGLEGVTVATTATDIKAPQNQGGTNRSTRSGKRFGANNNVVKQAADMTQSKTTEVAKDAAQVAPVSMTRRIVRAAVIPVTLSLGVMYYCMPQIMAIFAQREADPSMACSLTGRLFC